MKKFFQTISRTLTATLAGLALCAGTTQAADFPLDTPFKVTGSAYQTFTPSQDGVLWMQITSGAAQFNRRDFVLYYYANETRGTDVNVAWCNGVWSKDDTGLFGDNYADVTEAKWNVKGGTTYCVWSGTGDKTMIMTFLPGEKVEEEKPEEKDLRVKLGEAQSYEAGETYTYTCEEAGILTINVSTFSTAIGQRPATQHFFTGPDGRTVTCIAIEDGRGGTNFKFEVKPGVYKIHNPLRTSVTFTVTLEAGATVRTALVSTFPLPGLVSMYDTEATSYFLFSPTDVTFDGIDLVYTDTEGATQTIKNVRWEFLGGAYHVPTPHFMTMDGQRMTDPGEGGVNTTDVVFNHLSQEEGAPYKYIIRNVKRNGQSVTNNDVKGVEVDENGNFTVTYLVGVPPVVVEADLPEPFYFSWPQGDKRALATITFSKELDPTSEVEVSIIEGEQEFGVVPGEEDESWMIQPERVKISGNVITIDFSGDDFTYESAMEWGPDTDRITLHVQGVYGTNGLLAVSNGTYHYMPWLDYVAEEAPFVDDKVYDTQVDEMEATIQPVPVETAEDAAMVDPIGKLERVAMAWEGYELELTGEGGVTVEGPNGYCAEYDGETHCFGVENAELRIDMNSVVAEIVEIIKGENGDTNFGTYDGVYCVTVKKGTVKIYEGAYTRAVETPVYNDERKLYYNLDFTSISTGVTEIAAPADGLFRVYNLQGIEVLKSANALDLNSLPRGLYIVNGKKLVLGL